MGMQNETEVREIGDWVVRLRVPEGNGPHPVLVMLHGWTGNENAMWIFVRRLPENCMLIAPRGLYETPLGGFGWQPETGQGWPEVDDFRPSIDRLLEFLNTDNFPQGNLSQFRLIGFSQGSALANTIGLLHPEKIVSLAGLSGFLPEDAEKYVDGRPLEGKRAFLAHGSQDDMVPVDRARRAVKLMERAGAQVTYCEDDVGHKLSASCFRALQEFYQGGSSKPRK
jgi:phospholipase/carboxylesterase